MYSFFQDHYPIFHSGVINCIKLFFSFQLGFEIKSPFDYYYIEMHESGQSPYNYDVDLSKVEYLDKDSHVVYTMSGQQDVVKRLKKSNFICHEDNSNRQEDCLNNYYASKLNCTLPWVQTDNQEQTSSCDGKDKFEEFRNLSMSILGFGATNELYERGCIITNCKQKLWNIASVKKLENPKDFTWPAFIFSVKTKVLLRNEIELYTISSFFADIGGYLGLLLGESLVSYFLLGVKWVQKLFSFHNVQTL